MVKTTIKDAKSVASFTDLETLKTYLKENNLKVLRVEKIAYAQGIYGCNGYLLRLETDSQARYPIYAFTGRSLWMYKNCDSPELYNE